MAAFSGVGTWVDVFDWSEAYGDGELIGPDDVDAMAEAGVETLYVQGTRATGPDVLEQDRLEDLLDRADDRGLATVLWYLPSLVDPAADLRRLEALAGLDVDAIAVDIEARDVDDPAERGRRIVALSEDLREVLPDTAIAAVPVAPVLLEVVNEDWWPGFPWRALAGSYDAWLPMAYSTDRRADSGYRDAEHYTVENVERLRTNLGDPNAVVHPVGGVADGLVEDDVRALVRGARATEAVGASLYDWRTTGPDLLDPLEPLSRED
ncbi:MAG: hypothetical protein H0U89_11805 [Acidimicrobiia bacterium]|nr:hypothetical protein [Acidimicrobiia bacterium]